MRSLLRNPDGALVVLWCVDRGCRTLRNKRDDLGSFLADSSSLAHHLEREQSDSHVWLSQSRDWREQSQ